MNLGRVGGLLEAKKIAGMAEAHYAQIAPHLYCGPVVGAANIQLTAACSPNFLILESIERGTAFRPKCEEADPWETATSSAGRAGARGGVDEESRGRIRLRAKRCIGAGAGPVRPRE